MFFQAPQFYPSEHKHQQQKTHLGHAFVFDVPMVWKDLPDEVYSAPTLAFFRKRLKSYLLKKPFPT